jgi:hypothetical protein
MLAAKASSALKSMVTSQVGAHAGAVGLASVLASTGSDSGQGGVGAMSARGDVAGPIASAPSKACS